MERIFYFIRLHLKLILKKYFLIPSFCKECGRDVHDFQAPKDVWAKIEPLIKHGNVLCYDCFCELCEDAGLKPYWRLTE